MHDIFLNLVCHKCLIIPDKTGRSPVLFILKNVHIQLKRELFLTFPDPSISTELGACDIQSHKVTAIASKLSSLRQIKACLFANHLRKCHRIICECTAVKPHEVCRIGINYMYLRQIFCHEVYRLFCGFPRDIF